MQQAGGEPVSGGTEAAGDGATGDPDVALDRFSSESNRLLDEIIEQWQRGLRAARDRNSAGARLAQNEIQGCLSRLAADRDALEEGINSPELGREHRRRFADWTMRYRANINLAWFEGAAISGAVQMPPLHGGSLTSHSI